MPEKITYTPDNIDEVYEDAVHGTEHAETEIQSKWDQLVEKQSELEGQISSDEQELKDIRASHDFTNSEDFDDIPPDEVDSTIEGLIEMLQAEINEIEGETDDTTAQERETSELNLTPEEQTVLEDNKVQLRAYQLMQSIKSAKKELADVDSRLNEIANMNIGEILAQYSQTVEDINRIKELASAMFEEIAAQKNSDTRFNSSTLQFYSGDYPYFESGSDDLKWWTASDQKRLDREGGLPPREADQAEISNYVISKAIAQFEQEQEAREAQQAAAQTGQNPES